MIIQQATFGNLSADVLRLDLIHPFYGGNKIFKLKYNLEAALAQGFNQILTFGGAHSNHIYSTAGYCREKGIRAIGVIRGEERMIQESPTLRFAIESGMQLHFISREGYAIKNEGLLTELRKMYGEFFMIPEGGNNQLGVKGCAEILDEVKINYDYFFCACGTAATFSGIKISLRPGQIAVGISVLKGENTLINDANKWLREFGVDEILPIADAVTGRSCILNDYHFGGYARYSEELLQFKNQFEKENPIPLDYVYTSKLFFAVFDLLRQQRLKKNSSILLIHSGGLQGNEGFEKRYHLNATR